MYSKNRQFIRAVAGAGLFLLGGFAATYAGQVMLPGAGATLNVPVASFKERRFRTVIAQQYDYSCGSAAVASLLSYHYGDRVNEAEVFESMYVHGDQAAIAREGFSLLDMKKYLDRRGYNSNGYRVGLDKLAGNDMPAIALIDHNGYRHFVIVKGVSDQSVLLGDPALGLRAISRNQFEENWNGVVFVIVNQPRGQSDRFNRYNEWALVPRAPLGAAVSRRSLAAFNLGRPAAGDY